MGIALARWSAGGRGRAAEGSGELPAGLVDTWRRAAADGRWRRFEAEPGADGCWRAIHDDVSRQAGLGSPAGGVGSGSADGAVTPGAARERVTAALEGAAAGREVGRDVWPDLLALGWWTWWAECAPRPCAWHGAAVPSADQLTRGLLACSADAVRVRAAAGARRRPARHPLRRIVARLETEANQLLAALAEAARLLAAAGGEEAAVRAAVWQRLTWARSALAALQERLVYLPAGDVPPVLYTLLEEVFAGEPPVLAAVPSERAFAALLESRGRDGVWSALDEGIVPVPLEDLDNPLFWPLLGCWAALGPAPWAAAAGEGSEGEGGGGGGSVAGDAVALAAFGPSYPLALVTRLGARPGYGAARRSAARIEGLLAALEGQAGGKVQDEARAWATAMVALDAPFTSEGYAPETAPEGAWDALWAAACRRVRFPYGPANGAAAGELLEALREGELISSRRRRGAALAAGSREGQGEGNPAGQGAAGDGAPSPVAELYRLLDQVRDEPAAPAEILEAGWRFFMGPLREGLEAEWAAGSDPRGGTAMRRLEALNVLLIRSLDVAAVHRLYVREGLTR